jgi:preprotein translocase subunit SecG
MYPVLLAVHVLICFFMILIVLLQSGKGAGFAGLAGGGGSDAIFNAPSGSMFMRKLTTGLAAAFFMTSLFLTVLGARRYGSTVTQPGPMDFGAPPAAAPAEEAAPAAPPADKK